MFATDWPVPFDIHGPTSIIEANAGTQHWMRKVLDRQWRVEGCSAGTARGNVGY